MEKDEPIDKLDEWIQLFRPHLKKEERFLIRDEFQEKINALYRAIIDDNLLSDPSVSKHGDDSKQESNGISL